MGFKFRSVFVIFEDFENVVLYIDKPNVIDVVNPRLLFYTINFQLAELLFYSFSQDQKAQMTCLLESLWINPLLRKKKNNNTRQRDKEKNKVAAQHDPNIHKAFYKGQEDYRLITYQMHERLYHRLP